MTATRPTPPSGPPLPGPLGRGVAQRQPPARPTADAATTARRSLAVVMAASTLLGGYAHLVLYRDGYRDIPVGSIGRQFLLNAGTAAVIAAALVLAEVLRVLPSWIGRLAAVGGIAWGATSLLAFFLARSSRGWFGFHDQPGLNPSPEAAIAVFSESVTIALGIALLVAGLLNRPRSTARTE